MLELAWVTKHMCEWEYWYEILGASPVKSETRLYTQGPSKERPKKEEDHTRLVGATFNKQGNLPTSLSWAAARWDLHTHLSNPESLYRGLNWAESHIYLTDSLHTFSLKTVSLKMAPTVGMVGRLHIPRTGEGRGASDCPGPILRPAGGCVFSISSSNRESSWDLQLVTYVLELPFSPTSHPMKTHGNRLYSTYCFKAGISLEYILFCFWVN